jgi:methyl-accepting chemotaxis protein
MGQDEEALKAAIDDVNTVANELRDLQQKIQHYGEATKRLDKVGDALVKLSEGITSMHHGVASIVKRAEQAHADMTNSQAAVEALVSSVPDVVSRIEASNTTESIREFTKLLGEVRDMMKSQQDATQEMQSLVKGFAEVAADLKSVKESSGQQTQLLQLINQVLMQNVAGPVSENTRLLGDLKTNVQSVESGVDKATGGMATLSVKLINEIESMRKEISSLKGEASSSNQMLKEQSSRLDAMSKKKGLLF